MRPCPREGTLYAWLFLTFLCNAALAVERHYYIAAVYIDWDYASSGPQRSGAVYKKAVYREYEDATFKKAKPHPPELGLLGPTLRAQEGDVIVVTFRNMVEQPCNIHTHGIAYGKQSEGAYYFDNTSQKEKEDDVVYTGGSHTYTWEVTSAVTPEAADPACLTYTYFSHIDIVKDYNSGLIGTLLICKPGSLDDSGKQKHFHQENVLLFGIFDESLSWCSKGAPSSANSIKYTINGYANGTVPDLSVCAYSSVSWHFLGMSSSPELFSIHFNGQVFSQDGHRVSSVGIISGTTTSASMTAVHTGRWLISSFISKHQEAGMHGYLMVRTCEGFTKPQRKLTLQQKLDSQMWTYYIAAEEVTWDYTPNMPDYIDKDFRSIYMKQGPDRIGKKYRKAVFTQYTDETFTKRAEEKQRKMEQGIIGPVIRAQIRDQIRIVFNNKATRPYSIYPHGLTIDKAGEGANYPEGGNQTHAVQPGETHTYIWNVIDEDEPLPSDPRCLTRMYHSAVNTPRDIASGLVGPLLICKSQSLNKRNVQLKADKEQQAMFAIFDENKSWYLDKNIKEYCSDPDRVRKDAPDFYASNVMHSINGYMFESGQTLGFCNGEIVTWHVSSVGEQKGIQTVTFYGHTFELNNRQDDFLTLFPMTGETIAMNMDNKGDWLLSSLTSHDSTKGMRVKFKDVECFRDYVYEYEEGEGEYNIWKPEEYVPKETKSVVEELPPVEDMQTDYYADVLGIRSHKKSGNASQPNMELLDLSDFDYLDNLPGENRAKQNHGPAEEARNSSDSEPDTSSQAAMDVSSTSEVTVKNTASAPWNESINVNTTASWNENLNVNTTESWNESLNVNTTAPGNESLNVNTTAPGNENLNVNTTASWNENLNVKGTSMVSSVNKTTGDSINSTHMPMFNDTRLATAVPLLDSTSETSVPLATPSSNSSVNETESGYMLRNNASDWSDIQTNITEHNVSLALVDPNMVLSNMSEVPDNTGNDTQSSQNITAEWAADSNKTEHAFAYSETPQAPLTENLNVTDTEFVLLEGDALTEIGRIEEEAGSDIQGSLYDIIITVPEDSAATMVEGIADDTLSPEDTLILNATDNTEIGPVSEAFIEEENNGTFPNDRLLISVQSAEIGEILPINESSAEIFQNVSSSKSSSESGEWTPVNASHGSTGYGNALQETEEDWTSSEEVVIYLKHNTSHGIKTNPLGHPKEHWGYEGKHESVPMETPEDLTKYIQNETKPKKEPKKKVVHRRVRPFKGHAMKTRKKKQYKPQARSSLSPRGFQPRGARPISNEEDILNKAIVIGVPRTEFNDYDLFAIPDDYQDRKDSASNEEYEFIEYKDPYSQGVQTQGMTLDETTQYFLKNLPKGTNVRQYFLSAEEVEWDYGGYGQRRFDMKSDGLHTKFTKVVFRGYLDPNFKTPDIRGEVEEHLGILGPVIRAEVGDTIMVIFRNLASRPYSLHANGISYGKQMEGLNYVDNTPYWYQEDNAVRPNETYTYMWKVSSKMEPKDGEPDCRTWAYYSGVNPERDINSGLIGPLLICRKGSKKPVRDEVSREFVLLFMTFDENKSWYYEKNYEMIQRRHKKAVMDPLFKENIKFPAINGIIFGLKGLRMYSNQLANWHVFNMGASNDVHSVHFHGQTFLNHQSKLHRQGVYPLLPGGFATLQMWPSKPGLWLVESEVGLSQQKGMQSLFLVIDNDCYHPLGLMSGSIQDNQITASDARGYWKPHLARLDNSGKYNAWSTDKKDESWIQVNFQRPVVISKVATQGAKEMFSSNYVVNYTISYSIDRKTWTFYKGDNNEKEGDGDTVRKTLRRKIFLGNQGAHEVKENIFYPPMIGRYVRLHPLHSYNNPTVRMEFYGCELDGCSVPLGMKSGDIGDQQIKASSAASNWYAGTWEAWLARLDRQGTVNAWQAKYNDMQQWLQIELNDVKKITGIITQGAKSLGTQMFVSAFILEYSKDGVRWTKYTSDSDYEVSEFDGNNDNNDHKKNYIYPPIFAKFIRIVPRRWKNSITMRVELLGCDFE
ncbi:coagulation factor V [Alosa pseudoharengus]|uniref:coagulation factor V n=1 Tax=Alosa pseudoharengus TaxID=34774 RepID=UPI003F89D7F7